MGFEPTVSAGERPQTNTLDRATTWDRHFTFHRPQISSLIAEVMPLQDHFNITSLSVTNFQCCLFTSLSLSKFYKHYLYPFFNVLLTVLHLSIFISVINQLDAQNFCFTISFISCLYMFRACVLIIRRSNLHYTVSGIITHI